MKVVVATTKVRIFKQITTGSRKSTFRLLVVVATTKVRIFKQITTAMASQRTSRALLLLPQRYEFSSKSQHIAFSILFGWVVVATTKVRIFKQITTLIVFIILQFSCCCYHKGTNFQANHN